MVLASSRCLAAGFALALTGLAGAQSPTGGSAPFRQACLDATTDALVLNVAAHPDDEADRTLVWLRRKLGLRTVTVYSTCGSGGQNAIGREIGPALAKIRVRETLAAADHTGVIVRWLGFSDFGYSKTTDETIDWWGGKQELVTRMAAIVREFDPDLVFTNHGPNRGHGHHRASAVGIRTVLEANAANGRTVPLYQRAFLPRRVRSAPRAATPKAPPDVPPEVAASASTQKPDWECDPFEYDRARGTTYARQASRGRHEHRTQGPWSPHDPMRQSKDRWRMVFPIGSDAERDPIRQLGSVLREPAFKAVWTERGHDIAALEADLAAFAEDRAVADHVAAARRLLPALRAAYARLPRSAEGRRAAHRLVRRLDALQRVVLAGSGVDVEAYLPQTRLARVGTGNVRVLVHATDPALVTEISASCRGAQGAPVSEDGKGQRMLEIAFDLANSATDASAQGNGGGELGLPAIPFEPTWIDVDVRLTIDGLPMHVQRRLAADFESSLELDWGQPFLFVTSERDVERVLSLHVRYHGEDELTESVVLQLPRGVEAELLPTKVVLSPEHPIAKVLVRLRGASGAFESERAIGATLGSARADLRVVPAAVQVDPDVRVGLIRGPDDTLHRALEDLQVPFEVLDETTLAVTDLSRLRTLVLDIRAYYHRPDLADHRDRLLQFCADGGRIVSFYHKSREWNARDGHPLLAPYELEVGNDRVSQEDAPVTFLRPEHPLWNHPHSITKRDFEGWVQERGLNFPRKWDDDWVPLLEMSDTGEKPLKSGLLYASYERGDFVYCSLALYRQLRIGHLGAARILMNMLTPAAR